MSETLREVVGPFGRLRLPTPQVRPGMKFKVNVTAPTMPIMLVGTMAMGFTAPIQEADIKQPEDLKPSEITGPAKLGLTTREATHAPVTLLPEREIPPVYQVVEGDTISSIAKEYGFSTAELLALNGLGWQTELHAGQVLHLRKDAIAALGVLDNRPAYTVKKGDTLVSIAQSYGVSVYDLLSQNGLSWSAKIHVGQTLFIDSASTTVLAKLGATKYTPKPVTKTKTKSASKSVSNSNSSGSNTNGNTGGTSNAGEITYNYAQNPIVSLNSTQIANVQTIISVGKQLNVPDYGIIIALATAMQESTMRNLSYGDRDSVGIFQQRPSTGWGTPEQLQDVAYAAKLFYGGPSNPNKGKTRGLLDIKGWQTMELTKAAQAVQISAYPTAYAKWEKNARHWFNLYG
ncbi:MAG: LysM peptidoglycan-binding domain-containing protein [Microbacteriaceae bacterium]|nr:LysM peptidoglycan-binding domain-containing protein [Microbacteriaceae bacterium]